MKLGLGTVQFGLNYGINNDRGKPRIDEIRAIIHCAEANHIMVVDTAADYGDSEETLGRLIANRPNFQLITKISKDEAAHTSIDRSLKRLGREKLQGVLIHNFGQFQRFPSIWMEMMEARNKGLVKQIGFSLYFPEELELLLEKQIDFNLLQVPYNIFDRRFEKYFAPLKKRNVTVHTRSVFLQGLVFTDIRKLGSFFHPIKPKLERLGLLSLQSGKSIESLCLNFANSNPDVDNIIVGVDTEENLKSNIAALTQTMSADERKILECFKEDNEQMILPSNWKL